MNEVRNILVGFDFGEKVSQLCYYDRREGEPVSLPVKVGTGQYTFPNALSKKPGEDEWHFGLEVEYFVEQQDEIAVDNLYTLCLEQETVSEGLIAVAEACVRMILFRKIHRQCASHPWRSGSGKKHQRTDDHHAGADASDGGKHPGGMPGDGISKKPLFPAGL